MIKQKDQSIETLRGIAIILMVAGHVIGHTSSTGMKVSDDSAFRYFYYSFQYLRMPLFTVISGFVYSLRPVSEGKIFSFLKGKAGRILIPMIAVGVIQYLFRVYMPDINTTVELKNIWRILFFSFDQFWFLQAIFLVFIVVSVLDSNGFLNKFSNWLILCLFAFSLYIFIPILDTSFLSINGFLRLLPFFLLGCGLKRFDEQFVNKKFITTALVILIISISIQQLIWFIHFDIKSLPEKVLSSIIAVTGISILFKVKKENRLLARLGYYAFGIYLLHVFGTAGSRWALYKFGFSNEILTFSVGLITGLGIPILVELLIIPYKLPRKIFLGLK